jgi:hypothetical protein
MKYSPWLYMVAGAVALWVLFGRKVNATVTTGDVVIRYPTQAIAPTSTGDEAAAATNANALDAPPAYAR